MLFVRTFPAKVVNVGRVSGISGIRRQVDISYGDPQTVRLTLRVGTDELSELKYGDKVTLRVEVIPDETAEVAST